jgi:hypothetical protein
MSLQLSLLMDLFLLSIDAKRTDFIIPREVIVNEVKLKMDAGTPPAATAATSCAADAPHPHRATSPHAADSTSKHTTKRPHKKNRRKASILQYVNK